MAYKIVFDEVVRDTTDNNHKYQEGDTYPREGLKVDDHRIKEVFSKTKSHWSFKDFTVSELKTYLDLQGIDYDSKSKKSELLSIVGG